MIEDAACSRSPWSFSVSGVSGIENKFYKDRCNIEKLINVEDPRFDSAKTANLPQIDMAVILDCNVGADCADLDVPRNYSVVLAICSTSCLIIFPVD